METQIWELSDLVSYSQRKDLKNLVDSVLESRQLGSLGGNQLLRDIVSVSQNYFNALHNFL